MKASAPPCGQSAGLRPAPTMNGASRTLFAFQLLGAMIQLRVRVLAVLILLLVPSAALGQRLENRFEQTAEREIRAQAIVVESYWLEGAFSGGILGALAGAGFGLIAACLVNDGNCEPWPTVGQFSIGGAAIGGLLGGAIGSAVPKQDHGT